MRFPGETFPASAEKRLFQPTDVCVARPTAVSAGRRVFQAKGGDFRPNGVCFGETTRFSPKNEFFGDNAAPAMKTEWFVSPEALVRARLDQLMTQEQLAKKS